MRNRFALHSDIATRGYQLLKVKELAHELEELRVAKRSALVWPPLRIRCGVCGWSVWRGVRCRLSVGVVRSVVSW